MLPVKIEFFFLAELFYAYSQEMQEVDSWFLNIISVSDKLLGLT